MKRVLIVDDDPIVLRVYREGLSRLGLQVETAEDGLAALKALQQAKPDIMVLDLVMPKLSGVDVLKFVRANPKLSNLPVIIFSNSYAQEVAREAVAVGAQKGLLKTGCDPLLLAGVIGELLDGESATEAEAHLLGVAVPAPLPQVGVLPPETAPSSPARTLQSPPVALTLVSAHAGPQFANPESKAHARGEFLDKGKSICLGLQNLLEGFQAATTERERAARLQDLCRRFQFLNASAEVVGCLKIARMANALHALLLGMMDKPGRITPSALRTTTSAIEFLVHLLQTACGDPEPAVAPAQVLVVDDDQLSNRLVVSSLRAIQIKAESAFDPLVALRLLAEKYYDLVLLDVEMPGLDGINFCRRLRLFPGYQSTPVIFVTLHSDADTRARTVESGGNDFIAKPISPLELAVMVVMHWLTHHSTEVALEPERRRH